MRLTCQELQFCEILLHFESFAKCKHATGSLILKIVKKKKKNLDSYKNIFSIKFLKHLSRLRDNVVDLMKFTS